jgi:hypothetical protein
MPSSDRACAILLLNCQFDRRDGIGAGAEISDFSLHFEQALRALPAHLRSDAAKFQSAQIHRKARGRIERTGRRHCPHDLFPDAGERHRADDYGEKRRKKSGKGTLRWADARNGS